MLSSTNARRAPFNPGDRGYHAVYHEGEVNHCPGCGRTHWLIGRVSAECAFCSTAMPLKEAYTHGSAATRVFWSGSRPNYGELSAA
ncbi:hypothetical protein ACUXST_000261 [Sphingomonas sp. F9_3S_D5_B_2]